MPPLYQAKQLPVKPELDLEQPTQSRERELGSELCFHTNEAVPAHEPVYFPDEPKWHLRETDDASLFEECLTSDSLESFLTSIPILSALAYHQQFIFDAPASCTSLPGVSYKQ